MSETTKPNNRLLAALPVKEYKLLLPKLEEISLTHAETIYEPDDVIRHVYFLNRGMAWLLTRVTKGNLLEVGVVGNEGVVGLPVFLGVKTSSNHVIAQGNGTALRIKTKDFLKECERGGSLPKLLQRFTHALLMQTSQTVACTRFHLIKERLACLLLAMHDQTEADKFQITQEFLSNLLGVRREAVSKAATNLQQNGLIGYSRGKVSILNRAGLEAAACCCYSIIKEEYKKLFENSDRS
ncbi:MAG: Crp/Fnr family transcriptional regulator [Acidobacteria bacterium]|nr:Crp/Fnr family transcriptional regulator [Acidobacteriota bacterium]